MTLNHAQQGALNQIGLGFALIGEAIQAFAHASLDAEPDRTEIREHYSQRARDQRQYPVLHFVQYSPMQQVAWEDAKRVALANGYTTSGLGGFFTGPNALLRYCDRAKTQVEVTHAGRDRMKEIQERGLIQSDPEAA